MLRRLIALPVRRGRSGARSASTTALPAPKGLDYRPFQKEGIRRMLEMVTSPRIGLLCLREHPRAAGWGCGWS